MIEIRENGIAIVHRGLGWFGDKSEELEIRNLGGKWVSMISITTPTGKQEMEFKADEFIAIAEILKQLKQHRK
jgi:hypothetical protein